MVRKRIEQAEIPGTESPARIPELHALWLEIVALQEDVGAAREALKAKQDEARTALRKRGLDHYKIDGADLWAEPQPDRIKAKKPGGRKKGKIVKVTGGEEPRKDAE